MSLIQRIRGLQNCWEDWELRPGKLPLLISAACSTGLGNSQKLARKSLWNSVKPMPLAYSSRAGDSLELAQKLLHLLTDNTSAWNSCRGTMASKRRARAAERQTLTHNYTREDFWEMCFQDPPPWCRGEYCRRWCRCWVIRWQLKTLPVSILKTFFLVLTTCKTLLPCKNAWDQGCMMITNTTMITDMKVSAN